MQRLLLWREERERLGNWASTRKKRERKQLEYLQN